MRLNVYNLTISKTIKYGKCSRPHQNIKKKKKKSQIGKLQSIISTENTTTENKTFTTTIKQEIKNINK